MSTQAVYQRYQETLWRAWCARQRDEHDWFAPSPEAWARWHRISERGRREYDRAEHARHDDSFRPLWCDRCQSR